MALIVLFLVRLVKFQSMAFVLALQDTIWSMESVNFSQIVLLEQTGMDLLVFLSLVLREHTGMAQYVQLKQAIVQLVHTGMAIAVVHPQPHAHLVLTGMVICVSLTLLNVPKVHIGLEVHVNRCNVSVLLV